MKTAKDFVKIVKIDVTSPTYKEEFRADDSSLHGMFIEQNTKGQTPPKILSLYSQIQNLKDENQQLKENNKELNGIIQSLESQVL